MTTLYTISNRLINNCKQINFFTGSRYNHKLKELLNHNKQAFCYKLYIPEEYITKNINDQQQGKILKINDDNKKDFQCFNYLDKYTDNINYDCPYPLYYPCHRLIMKNFDGVDATEYWKENKGENLCKEGLIWTVNNNIKLELIDYHPIHINSS